MVVVAASPFGRSLLLEVLVVWAFLHGVAVALGIPPGSWASTVWVVVVAVAITSAELRRRRVLGLFAALGLSRVALWSGAVTAVVVLEALLRAGLSAAGIP